ncbi:MAG: ABC transporter ATP-binding protein [Gammaproteobacteria bacterium]|nr:ABC transporter ATP-binding protein [Gammaproteobacteria bacterium]
MYDDELYDDGHDARHASGKLQTGLWRRLADFAWPYRRGIAGLAACAVVTAAADVSFPLITRGLIDSIAEHGSEAVLWPWALAYAIATLMLCASIGGFVWLGGRIRTQIAHDIRQAAFENVQQLSFAFFDRRPVGWLMARMTSDCERLSNIFAWGILDLVWGVSMMTGAVIAMTFMSPPLMLVVVAIVPLLALASARFKRRILTTARDVRRSNAMITASFNESVTGVLTTRAFNREDDNHARFGVLADNMYNASVRNLLHSALYLPVVLALASIAMGLALALGGIQLLGGLITAGTLVAFLTYARHFFDPVEQLAGWFAELQMAQASAERVLSLVDAVPEVRDRPDVAAKGRQAMPAQRTERIERIEFADVAFAYGNGIPVLSDVDLTLERDKVTALVGHTGSGKSTLASLLCRYYDPVGGAVLVDGIDYRNLPLASWQARLGVVLQTPHVFTGTIRDNVRYGRLDATDAEVDAALEAVGAMTFVRGLPDGVDFQVGEAGSRLSSGQKQLVSLARVMLADPDVVILDEATSSIDSETEFRIQRAMRKLFAGRIALVIAHRLSTIREAEQIVVVDGGRIIERGDHARLMQADGAYAGLYRVQRASDAARAGHWAEVTVESA